MNLSFTPEEERFRLEVRQFLAENLPALSRYARRLVMIDHQLGDGGHRRMRFAALGRTA